MTCVFQNTSSPYTILRAPNHAAYDMGSTGSNPKSWFISLFLYGTDSLNTQNLIWYANGFPVSGWRLQIGSKDEFQLSIAGTTWKTGIDAHDPNARQHLGVLADRNAGHVKFFVDGLLDTTATGLSGEDGTPSGSQTLDIGGRENLGVKNPFEGHLCDIALLGVDVNSSPDADAMARLNYDLYNGWMTPWRWQDVYTGLFNDLLGYWPLQDSGDASYNQTVADGDDGLIDRSDASNNLATDTGSNQPSWGKSSFLGLTRY